jgi:hypothetical protein
LTDEDLEALKSATQKSCDGLGSAKSDGKLGRNKNTRRQDKMWKGELLDGLIMADLLNF